MEIASPLSMVFGLNVTDCISPYAIITCVCVCLCVCVYAAFVDLRKTVGDRDVVFLNARNKIRPNL